MNPMMKNIQGQSQSIIPSHFKQMMNTIRSCGNPQMMLNQMLGNNPAYKQVMNYVNENGGDAQVAFYKMAQEKGVDPNEILNQLR